MSSDKEINVFLLEQLGMAERVLKVMDDTGDIEKAREALEYEKRLVERKLYQTPPLVPPEN